MAFVWFQGTAVQILVGEKIFPLSFLNCDLMIVLNLWINSKTLLVPFYCISPSCGFSQISKWDSFTKLCHNTNWSLNIVSIPLSNYCNCFVIDKMKCIQITYSAHFLLLHLRLTLCYFKSKVINLSSQIKYLQYSFEKESEAIWLFKPLVAKVVNESF